MASTTLMSALATACLLLIVLALSEARPILTTLHESSTAETVVLHHTMLPAANFSIAVDISRQPALQSATAFDTSKDDLAAHVVTPQAMGLGDCHTSDIVIEQDEVVGVGLPTFQVQITNVCTNPVCSISFLVVHCGLFHTGDVLVDPKVFKRLDASKGTCIVNDGQVIPNAGTITFRYREIWKEPITFLSARVFCHG